MRCTTSTSWRWAAPPSAPASTRRPASPRRRRQEIAKLTDLPFVSAPNKFTVQGSHDALVALSGTMRTLAVSLYKIANDIRLVASGPRAGLGELILPENEPGSSIMPGKVNPTQAEALTMIAAQVMANDVAVGFGGAGGFLEMNVYKPLMIFNLMNSIVLLADGCTNFRQFMIEGTRPNLKVIKSHLERSLMLVTALAPVIGYDKASQIAHHATEHDLTLKESALQLGHISEAEFDRIVDPAKMVQPLRGELTGTRASVPPTIRRRKRCAYGVRPLAVAALAVAVWPLGAIAQGTISDLPRKETLIVENPEGTIKNAGWFNIWAINAGSQSNGLQQLGDGHLLVHRPAEGRRRRVGQLARLGEADLQRRLHRDDGEAAQGHLSGATASSSPPTTCVYTIQTHMKTNGLRWSAPVQINVAEVTAPDPQTVVFKLKKPNSRFHALFTVRWNAMWMMPKHVFEKVPDITEVRQQSAGDARRLHAEVVRPERQMVHLAEARRLEAHDGRALRRARAEVRRLYRSRPAGQARDRADEPRARHHPRHLARGHVHARQAVADLARLVQGLPLRPSRPDPAGGAAATPRTRCSRTATSAGRSRC